MDNQVYTQEETQKKEGIHIVPILALVFGILGLIACCLPCLGYPVAITAIVLGIIGLSKNGRGLAIAGISLGTVSFVLSLINSILGVMSAME